MSTIITRQEGDTAKNAPLTNSELDTNFINLNGDKMEKTSNLSDLNNTATARSNLDVYNKEETTSEAIAMAIALG
jgi:hypothetical protein